MGNNFSLQTVKVKSKIASQRMQQHISKKENALQKQTRAIAQLLADGKEQSARIKVEGILREENLCRVYEWLQMMCDLIHQRCKQIETSKECPEDLTESICTILYCAKRVDIPELTELGLQFRAKWGEKWFEASIENRSGRVSKQIIEKLSPQPPAREEVVSKLKKIAEKYDVPWEPGTSDDSGMPSIVGHRDEYTVEFSFKPFGMEWTPTEDNKNLWVSSIHPMSQAEKGGVVSGSMLIQLNGIDITNIGAASIHEKSATLGLPLRVTFRKPTISPNEKADKVNPETVNRCVGLLKDPSRWEFSDEQKRQLCKQNGANGAESSAAIFIAQFMIESGHNSQPIIHQPVVQQYQQPQQYQQFQPQMQQQFHPQIQQQFQPQIQQQFQSQIQQQFQSQIQQQFQPQIQQQFQPQPQQQFQPQPQQQFQPQPQVQQFQPQPQQQFPFQAQEYSVPNGEYYPPGPDKIDSLTPLDGKNGNPPPAFSDSSFTTTDQPSTNNDFDLDNLEARFAKLRDGL